MVGMSGTAELVAQNGDFVLHRLKRASRSMHTVHLGTKSNDC